jgi:hypothetical protein
LERWGRYYGDGRRRLREVRDAGVYYYYHHWFNFTRKGGSFFIVLNN